MKRLFPWLIIGGGAATLAGCKERIVKNATNEATQTAISAIQSVEPMNLYVVAGGGLVVAGVIMVIFGARSSGIMLSASGVCMSIFGQAMTVYPWLSLVMVGIAAIISVTVAYEKYRDWKVTKEIVRAVEKTPSAKENICNGDKNKQNKVRPIIQKAKNELRRNGQL